MNQATIDIAELKSALGNEGYYFAKGFFPPDVVERVKVGVERVADELIDRFIANGKITDPCSGLPWDLRVARAFESNPDALPKVIRWDLHEAEFYDLLCYPPLLDIAEELIGGELRIYPNYNLRPKCPNSSVGVVPWHQDSEYTRIHPESDDPDALRLVSFWTPLVPVNRENGCMQFIRGSHRRGTLAHSFVEHDFVHLVPEELDPMLENLEVVDIALDPGDVVIYDHRIVHRGLPNRSERIRWSMDFRYQDAGQETQRRWKGYVVRSRKDPASAIQDRDHWARVAYQ